MSTEEQIVKLTVVEGEPVLSVEVTQEDDLHDLATRQRDSGTVSFNAVEFPPPISEIDVVIYYRGNQMQFRGIIVSWRPGAAVLRPKDGDRLFADLFSLISGKSPEAPIADDEPDPPDPFADGGPAPRLPASASSPRIAAPLSSPQIAAPISSPERPTPGQSPTSTPQVGVPLSSPRVSASVSPDRADSAAAPASEEVRDTDQPKVRSATGPQEAARPENLALHFLDTLAVSEPIARGNEPGAAIGQLFTEQSRSAELFLKGVSDNGSMWCLFSKGGFVRRAYRRPAAQGTTLATLLQHQKHLTHEQAEAVVWVAAGSGISEEDALLKLGFLPPEFVEQAATAKARIVMAMMAKEQRVMYSLHTLLEPQLGDVKAMKTPSAPARVAPAKVSGLQEAMTKYKELRTEEAEEEQKELLSLIPTIKGDVAALAERLKLGPKGEKFFANCLTGNFPLRKVYTLTNLSRRNTFAMIFALRDVGLLEFVAADNEEILTAELIEMVGTRFATLEKGNLFDRLDLHWSATGIEIEEAEQNFLKHLSSATPSRVGAEVADKARQAAAGIQEASRLLASVELRKEHRLSFLEPFNIQQGLDLVCSHLEMAIYRHDRKEVARLLDRIMEIEPRLGNAKRAEALRKLSGKDK